MRKDARIEVCSWLDIRYRVQIASKEFEVHIPNLRLSESVEVELEGFSRLTTGGVKYWTLVEQTEEGQSGG